MVITSAQILAQGALSNSSTLLYSSPTSPAEDAFITSIKFVNTNTTTARLVNLYLLKVGGAQTQWSPMDFSLAAKADVEMTDNAQQIRLGPGDEIYAKQDSGTDVVFTVCGLRNQ